MFWRKKSDGFDWHKHVRTTIKIRREARKQKLDGAVDLAVGGIKGAGRAGVSAGFSGIDAINRLVVAPIAWCGRAISSALGLASRGLTVVLEPVGRLTERQGWAPWLALTGVVAGLLGIGRAQVDGWDVVALALGLAGLAIVLALVLPPLLTGRGPATIAAASARLADTWKRIPGAGALPIVAQRGITVTLLAALVGGAGWGLARTVKMPTASLASLPGFSRPVVEGTATAVTGDTLRFREQTLKLSGVVAPTLDQSCGGQGREQRWRCGEAARTHLREMTRGKTLRCELGAAAATGPTPATCRIGSVDLAEEMVSRGIVFAEQGLFSSYGRQEQDARNARRGIWRGSAERPEEYRARLWEAAKKSAPQGCPIKGQISRRERTYVAPWDSGYSRARVREDRGERWFCSEQEALTAGWRPQGQS